MYYPSDDILKVEYVAKIVCGSESEGNRQKGKLNYFKRCSQRCDQQNDQINKDKTDQNFKLRSS